MSTLVDFQQQRKRSKVYPQLNFLLLRKIAPEFSFSMWKSVCKCGSVCMCVIGHTSRPHMCMYVCTDVNILFPASSSFVSLTFNSTCLNFRFKFIVVFVPLGTFLAISAFGKKYWLKKSMSFSVASSLFSLLTTLLYLYPISQFSVYVPVLA